MLCVGLAVVEAAVEDADESVSERSGGLVVVLAAGASVVVEGPGAGGGV